MPFVVNKNYKEIKGELKQKLKNSKKAFNCEHTNKPLYARGFCRSCYEKWLRKNNPKFAERQRKNNEKWRKKYYEKKKQSNKNWRAKQDPEYLKKIARLKTLQKYNMTFEDYDNLLKKQNNCCAICKTKPKNGKNLHIDHDHNTGLIRGLLCFRCNFGISYFNDDLEIIKNLYFYMIKAEKENNDLPKGE